MSEIAISSEDFGKFREFFYRQTGIHFDESKRYFVDKRLAERIELSGAETFRSYFSLLRFQASGEELQTLTNLMTVNETYFLREDYSRALFDLEQVLKIEPRHFDALAGLGAVLRELGKDKEALAVFEQALALDPHLESVEKAVAEMKLKGVAGRDL